MKDLLPEAFENDFKPKILNYNLFKLELDNFDRLKNAGGPINDKLILHCDKWNLSNLKRSDMTEEKYSEIIDGTVNFIINIFKDFSIDIDYNSIKDIVKNFYNINISAPNYYSIKEYIIRKIDPLIEEK